MARRIARLSDRTVKTVSKPGLLNDGGNLYLMVDKLKPGAKGPPAKRWCFIFQWNGKRKEMGLGALNAVTLADARGLATTYRGLLARNLNPIEVRRAEQRKQAAGSTFGEVATRLHASKKDGWKNDKVKVQWLTAMKRHCASIWEQPVQTVTTADIEAVLKPIWVAKAETGRKIRGRIEDVLNAAQVAGLVDSDKANPARWRGHLSHILPKNKRLQRGHHTALPYAETPAFVTRVRQYNSMSMLCLEFTILTAVRSGEAMGARWSEIDLIEAVWTIPKERMKMDAPHRVPLSDRCIAILRQLEPLRASADGYVFPGRKKGKPLSSMALEMAMRRLKEKATPHGFRSTFRDWCGDCTTFEREVAEAALAHKVGNDTELAYRRGDALSKRRKLMQAWADYCGGVEKVVQLPQAAGG